MEIKQRAASGSLQSNDCLVEVEPADRLVLDLQSTVLERFGHLIEQAVREAAAALGVKAARIALDDRGALDCTIRARVTTALRRAAATPS